jgi:hypothetical protein
MYIQRMALSALLISMIKLSAAEDMQALLPESAMCDHYFKKPLPLNSVSFPVKKRILKNHSCSRGPLKKRLTNKLYDEQQKNAVIICKNSNELNERAIRLQRHREKLEILHLSGLVGYNPGTMERMRSINAHNAEHSEEAIIRFCERNFI